MMRENVLQRQVAQYLDLLGLLWCHVANERQTSPARGGRLKRQGVKPGVPDVLIFSAPRCAIELKAGRNRLTAHQREWLAALAREGWQVAVCRSLDAVMAMMQCLGHSRKH